MSDSNSVEVDDQEKTAKNKSNKNNREEPKAKRQRTDIGDKSVLNLTELFRRLFAKKEMHISMVGLDGAGKTTILYKLGENVIETSSRGLNMETVHHKNITFNVWDVGGQHKTRPQWSNYFQDTKGLIFVVDITDRDRVVEARDELHRLLNEELLKDVVLLVFANKGDLADGMNKAEITEKLGLSSPLRQRHCHVQITCATSGEGLYEGLDWLSRKIRYTCATSGEGVNKGLNLLRNMRDTKNYFYRKYNDLPIGYFFQPSDEELIDFLVRLIAKKDIFPDRVNRVNLFCNHPAIIIKSHYLHHYMLDTRKYYLFYCNVPADAKYSLKGYHHFQDRAKGVWEATTKSFIFHCNLLDKTTRYGERQKFRYKPVNETTSSWRMVMYGLPNFPRPQGLPDIPCPQSNMVILKVYESADSKNTVAVKSLANMERDVLETSHTWSTHCAKVRLLEAALRQEMMKQDSSWLDLGAKTHIIKKVKKYDRDEHKEADEIMKRTSAKRIAKVILKTRSKHTRD